MHFTVVGTLDGAFGPWLARGDAGAVVLHRARGLPQIRGLRGVADAFAQVEVDGRSYDVEAYVPGRPLHEVPLSDEQRRGVLGAVARSLRALHQGGLGHGAVGPGTVRLTQDGAVCLVGARRGDPRDDAEALGTLAGALWDEIPGDVAARLEAGLDAWTNEPLGLLPALPPQEDPVQPHDLAGASVALAAAAPAAPSVRPPKVQVAMVAGLTLVLGLLAGALLGGCGPPRPPGPPVEVQLHVPGAIQVAAYCGGAKTYRTEGNNADTLVFQPGPKDTTTCEIEAPLSPVMPLRGTLQLTTSWTYQCDRDGVTLACRPLEGTADP